jgi:asparagine synthase (glutamine-hydrolysing)
LVDDLLLKTDRMSMAPGLEVRSPFLDADLMSFAARLPPRLKARSLCLKRALRAAVTDLLTPEILKRSKHRFGVPLDRGFGEDLESYVRSTLAAPGARVKEYLAPAAVDRLLAAHHAGERNHGHALWHLLTLEVFLRREGW